MARYHYRTYRKKRKQNRLWYIVLLLVLFVGVKTFVRGPSESRGKVIDEFNLIPACPNDLDSALAAPAFIQNQQLLEMSESTSERNAKATDLIDEATQRLNTSPAMLIEARDKLNQALLISVYQSQRTAAKKVLAELAEKWLFGRTVFANDRLCGSYKVKPGDTLGQISRNFKVPYEIIMQLNNISVPTALQAGRAIKVVNGPFHVRLSRSTFTLDLYLQDTFVKSFPVGLGRSGMETPTGIWIVKPAGKVISPAWTDPVSGETYEAEDPAYPLGARWIGLEGIEGNAKGRSGFAIHGTKNRESISTASSRGCIRLYNDDVILVYNMLMPGLSNVIIVD